MSTGPIKPKVKGRHRRVFEVFRSAETSSQQWQWRWRCWAKNGQIIATGGEAFEKRGHAARMAASFMSSPFAVAPDVLVVDGKQL